MRRDYDQWVFIGVLVMLFLVSLCGLSLMLMLAVAHVPIVGHVVGVLGMFLFATCGLITGIALAVEAKHVR